MRFALNVLYIAELDRKLLIFIYSMSVSDLNGFLFLVQHTFFRMNSVSPLGHTK